MFGGGGFGGDQFGGGAGGFVPSQANDNAYGGGGSSGGGKKQAQTLRTVTIRQLVTDLANAVDDNFTVDGVPLANVAVVGRIVNVHDRNMSLAITITDGTGELELSHWMQDEDEEMAANKKAEWRPGVYIKAHGHMRVFDRKTVLAAFSIRTITNFNEVTYHFLRAIFEHLHITKGGACAQAPQQAAGAYGAPAGGGWAGGQQQFGGGGGATAYAGSGLGAGGNAASDQVLELIRGCNSDNGVHKQEIYSKLSAQFGQGAIDTALQGLVDEAHIYTTTDDDHFRAA